MFGTFPDLIVSEPAKSLHPPFSSGRKEKDDSVFAWDIKEKMVGAAGFEPTTP